MSNEMEEPDLPMITRADLVMWQFCQRFVRIGKILLGIGIVLIVGLGAYRLEVESLKST